MRSLVLIGCLGLVAACRSAAPAAPVQGRPGAAVAVIPGPAPSCLDECLGRYPERADPAAYHGYCEELCAPVEAPSESCLSGCEGSHEPGASYDDQGEYVAGIDERSDDQIDDDRRQCESECATVPVLSPQAMSACEDACVTSGGGDELQCQMDCDPNPYDQCMYAPCD